jgi:hypothetical protein
MILSMKIEAYTSDRARNGRLRGSFFNLVIHVPFLAVAIRGVRYDLMQPYPGFQPKHVQTLVPLIIAEANIFVAELMEKTDSPDAFKLGDLAQGLTIDVISAVALGKSFHAQTTPSGMGIKGPDGVLTAFHEVQININDRGNPKLAMINPIRLWKLRKYEK